VSEVDTCEEEENYDGMEEELSVAALYQQRRSQQGITIDQITSLNDNTNLIRAPSKDKIRLCQTSQYPGQHGIPHPMQEREDGRVRGRRNEQKKSAFSAASLYIKE
jgi:hypothetical protein